METEWLLRAENHSYHDITVYIVADDDAPCIVIGGAHQREDSYIISPTTARELAAHLARMADEIEGKS